MQNDEYYFNAIISICHDHLSAHHAEYMMSRGISHSVLEEFKVGSFDLDLLKAIPVNFLLERKIAVRKRNGIYSRFQSRIIVPIYNQYGVPVAIVGRVINDSSGCAKYYNSAYAKTDVLFGMDKAKVDILKNNVAIVVEGNIDVLSAFECGIKNVVGISGVMMSDKHVHLLLRYCNRIVLALDSDDAGNTAMAKIMSRLKYYIDNGLLSVYRAPLSEYKDLNEMLCKSGKENTREFLLSSMACRRSDSSQSKSKLSDWEWV